MQSNSMASNALRNIAHEVIIKLYEAKEVTALELLKLHCEGALEEINKEQNNERKASEVVELLKPALINIP